MKRTRRIKEYEENETVRSQGSFCDENGLVHIRVPLLGETPNKIIKRRSKSEPVTFETVKPRPKITEEKKEEQRIKTIDDGKAKLIEPPIHRV